ncbi:hypothetical protein EV426DRAFT_392972 [Tirmania nivea]|nr:hypothetical protein EV426DRAFT_392972 [Tirmania nivea]
MSFAPPRARSESRNRSTNNTDTNTDVATMTATATRQQLRGDYSLRERSGIGSKSSSSPFPASQLPRNRGTNPNSSTWEMGNSSNANEGEKNTWTGSWSKIQNIASTVLGSVGGLEEGEEERKRRIRIAEGRRRAGLDTFNGGKSSGSSSSPASSSSASTLRSRVSGSTLGEGEGDLRARGQRKVEEDEKKPRRSPNASAVTSTSISSRPLYKRTTSPDLLPPQNRASSSPPSTGRGEDTLAYIHKVRPTDTLEGVVIMYNIHPSALRRANRLWMGDSIQWRRELYLPVDECLVKGRLLTKEEEEVEEMGKQNQDREDRKSESKEPCLLDLSESEASRNISITGTQARRKDAPPSIPDSIPETVGKHSPPTNSTFKGEDSSHRHHSYVVISGIGRVEIGRLSRNTLSHFPSRKGRGRGLSASSTTIPEDMRILDPSATSSSSSVFKTDGKVSEAYTGLAGRQTAAGGDVPTFGKMFGQMARETRDGMENVGSLVEGFVRKVVVKVGEMARDGTEAAIELAEHVGNGGERAQVGGECRRIGEAGDGTGRRPIRERSGGGVESGSARGLRGRGSLFPGSDSAVESRTSSRSARNMIGDKR